MKKGVEFCPRVSGLQVMPATAGEEVLNGKHGVSTACPAGSPSTRGRQKPFCHFGSQPPSGGCFNTPELEAVAQEVEDTIIQDHEGGCGRRQ